MIRAEEVTIREDLVRFLAELAGAIRSGATRTEHSSPAEFIEAAGGWVADMDGYFLKRGEAAPSTPTWGLIASIFAAATVYE